MRARLRSPRFPASYGVVDGQRCWDQKNRHDPRESWRKVVEDEVRFSVLAAGSSESRIQTDHQIPSSSD
jgi:hypothetical protein